LGLLLSYCKNEIKTISEAYNLKYILLYHEYFAATENDETALKYVKKAVNKLNLSYR